MQARRGAAVGRLRAAGVTAAVVALDQLTKSAVVATIPRDDSVELVGGWLRLSHFRNTGAAFGLLRGLGGLLALAAVVGVVVFVVIVLREPSAPVMVGAALVAGGALGNLLDRLFRGPIGRGGVVDFVDLSFWPAFNVADSAITIGAVVLVLFGSGERS